MSNSELFTSSIAKKYVMALTGLFLISFLVIHCTINSLIFVNDGGETFNEAAHFMSHNIVIRILEVGLFFGLVLHMVQSLILTLKNRKARPVAYAVAPSNESSKWYARSMGILGSLLLLFLVVHMSNFWVPTKQAVFADLEHNSFEAMKTVFAEWYFVAIYLVGVGSLSYHLMHGFQSAFQSLGLNHKKYTPVIKTVGFWFSIIVPAIFAAMPLAIYLGVIE
ncbi:MAG: succinate dehydrogenase cytochrome b subunit [Bacteroidetes bacterium]|nr:succinate dehydrogenase cytochrome b subunit [Bacteroidota bacterium]